MTSPLPPLPWEVLLLVAYHLDPKTLAIASCVSKLWLISMSSNYLWRPIFTAHFPSLSTLQHAHPTVSFRRLFTIGYATSKYCLQNPVKTKLSLNDLVFIIFVSICESRIFTLMIPSDEVVTDPHGLFRFDFEIDESEWVREGLERSEDHMECDTERVQRGFLHDGQCGEVGILGEWRGVVLGGASNFGMLFECGGELCGSGFKIRDWQWEGERWEGENEEGECGDFEYYGLEICVP